MAYEILPEEYDLLTWDVDYKGITVFITGLLKENGIHEGLVLDLACGTGSVSYLLAQNGYEVIAADASEAMLMAAQGKLAGFDSENTPPIFIKQRMEKLDLFGTVDACVCTLDSVNYITDTTDLAEVFKRVHLFLNPGGVFIFDINSRHKLENMDGCTFSDEREGVFCVWRVAKASDRRYQFVVDLFTRNGESWRRGTEEHFEFAYEADELQVMLERAGFADISVYGGINKEAVRAETDRLYFVAKKAD